MKYDNDGHIKQTGYILKLMHRHACYFRKEKMFENEIWVLEKQHSSSNISSCHALLIGQCEIGRS